MATQHSRSAARLMMAPAVILLLGWMLVPLTMTLYFSFKRYLPLRGDSLERGLEWVGFENYTYLWRDQSYASPYYHSTGGNPGPYVETHFRDNVFLYPYDSPQAGTTGPLVGDLWTKYGTDFSFRADLRILTPDVAINVLEFRLTSTTGEWRYCWQGP